MNRIALPLAVLFIFAAAPKSAAADIPPPRVTKCSGKKVGDSCNHGGKEGVCQKSTCSRSRPGRDGKIHTSTRDCVKCLPPKKADEKPAPTTEPEPAPAPPKDKPKNQSLSTQSMGLGLGGLVLGLGVFGAWLLRRKEPGHE